MKYEFETNLERWEEGSGGWYYVYLPAEIYEEIREVTSGKKRGFGTVKVEANMGKSTWETSIFPDTKSQKYILFIKKSVRSAENIELGNKIKVKITISL